MGDLSPHFSRREFRCRHCGAVRVDPHLVEHLEVLRAMVGRPLVIVSGYRCPTHNRNVGGASRSQHLYGRAADLVDGYATVSQARRAGFTGIGRDADGSALHVDVRHGPRAEWLYS